MILSRNSSKETERQLKSIAKTASTYVGELLEKCARLHMLQQELAHKTSSLAQIMAEAANDDYSQSSQESLSSSGEQSD